MAINLDAIVVQLVIDLIILSPVLWLAGRVVVGKGKAKFSHAVLIVLIGAIVGGIFGFFFSGVIATIIILLIWLWLIKHFFQSGWLQAFGIAIVAIIIFVVIAFVLGLLGLALFTLI